MYWSYMFLKWQVIKSFISTPWRTKYFRKSGSLDSSVPVISEENTRQHGWVFSYGQILRILCNFAMSFIKVQNAIWKLRSTLVLCYKGGHYVKTDYVISEGWGKKEKKKKEKKKPGTNRNTLLTSWLLTLGYTFITF